MNESTPPPVVMPGANAMQPRMVLWCITVVAVGLSLFQLYSAGIQPLGLFYQRSIHLALIMLLAFLMFPVFGPTRKRGVLGWGIDLIFFAGALTTGGYLVLFLDEIINRAGFWSDTDILVACIATVTVLEASRRAVGFGMTVIGLLAIIYAFAGPRGELPWLGEWMPGILEHRGYTLERVAGQLYLGQEGIFGLPLGVAATYIFIFVLFGAFLESTGAGKFFIDMAYAATGRQRGGPAKAAVLASAGMVSIPGSAIANVVTTGAFTIPLMKKLGYQPKQAGGIEAAASTGGQIMPPLMGAGAFFNCGIYQHALFGNRESQHSAGDYVLCNGVSICPYHCIEAGNAGIGEKRVAANAPSHDRWLALPASSSGTSVAASDEYVANARGVLRRGHHHRCGGSSLCALVLLYCSQARSAGHHEPHQKCGVGGAR